MPNLDDMDAPARTNGFRRWFRRRPLWKVAALVFVIGGLVMWVNGGESNTFSGATVPVRRGPLAITVVEGGSIAALESQEVKSEVEGTTKILSIVEEGYTVTQEDVEQKKVLVELDSKELRDRQISQELEYQNALAAFTEAKEEYQIQVNQNRSDITAAELAVKFARMDFEKFMGAQAAAEILNQITFEEDVDVPLPSSDLPLVEEQKSEEDAPANGAEKPAELAATAFAPPAAPPELVVVAPAKPSITIDYEKYADIGILGDGEAGQRLRKLEDEEVLAKKELGLARTQFEGTQRLAEKQFVTKNELENDQLKVERNEIALKSAETSKELFIRYEFPKTAEKLLSDYEEAHRKLVRSKKLAMSKLAQAEAKLKSSEARYTLQARKRREIQEQIEKCTIRAERPGLVVYGAGERWRDDDRIEEGATVRQRQKIITIPDMSQMAVEVRLHESVINKIQKGQKAKIRVDTFPDEELTGEVFKIAILPDSENRWMNPDVKVFVTKISIDGIHPWLKPELSAQVEILIKELPDVLYVPIQAVVPMNGNRVCYVNRLGGPEPRVVETGESNDQFIEIKSGLKEGEQVLLRAPVSAEKSEKDEAQPEEKDRRQRPQKKSGAEKSPKSETPPAQEK